MIDKNFVKDIELYICEKFGYRNSVYVNPTCNGCCIDIHEKNVKPIFSSVGIQQGCQRFSRPLHHLSEPCLREKLPREFIGLGKFLQGVCSTLRFLLPRHRE